MTEKLLRESDVLAVVERWVRWCKRKECAFNPNAAAVAMYAMEDIRALPPATTDTEVEKLRAAVETWMRKWAEFGDDPLLLGEDCEAFYRAAEKYFARTTLGDKTP
jgi:hypothetical protein